MMFLKNTKIQHRNNKGFTLVELIVVLVLMTIIISLSIAGILTWQDWSRFKKENTAAETIFYSVQDFFTKLDATNAFDSYIVSKIEKEKSDLFLADTNNRGIFANRIYYDEDMYYVWDSYGDSDGTPIWINTPSGLSNDEKAKYQGSIWFLSAEQNDYDKYMDGTLTKPGTKLLFDMITTSISDDSILNGAILVEFSPEAGQVFSVCYSDRTGSFTYLADAPDGSVSVLDRKESVRRKLDVGYYSAQSLSVPISGRSKTALGNIRLENNETLDIVIVEDAGKNVPDTSHYAVDVCPVIVNADQTKYADVDSPLFTIDFDLSTAKSNANLADALSRPTFAEVTLYEGYYISDTFCKLVEDGDASISKFYKDAAVSRDEYTKFKASFPIWVSKSDANETLINILLDGADVQAQSYLCADKNKPEPSFINTYSFYRFGLDLDSDSIMEIAARLLSEDDSNVQISNFTSPVFEDGRKENDKRIYEIKNARHLYNVRFETDFKDKRKLESERVTERDFVVIDDIDWDKFTNKTPNDDNFNYFLNSYRIGTESGINYDGLDNLINKKYASGSNDTSGYAFPGFRNLGVNDTFKGVDAGGRYTAISNLYISFTANMTYGVYGKDTKEEWMSSNLADYGRYDTLYPQTLDVDWANINTFDQNTYKELHPTHVKAMKGLLPLGLFAQNCGNISDLELNKHRVLGMEDLGVTDSNGEKVVFYTNMVGGFAGNNLGTLSNLKLRNVSSLASSNTRDNELENVENATHINGRRDVGGILGRISWNAGNETDITLSGLENYGNVTGMENVGGVVGRAYLIREFTTNITDGNRTRDLQNYYFRRLYYEDGYDIYGEFNDEGKYVAGSSKNIDNRTVVRIDKLTIKDCINRGEVCGDDLVYSNLIYHCENLIETQKIGNNAEGFTLMHHDFNNYLHQCAFIGGIAGITMDGQYYDCRNTGNGYESKWGNKFGHNDIKLTVENCNSYRLYSNADLAALYSKNGGTWKGTVSEGHIADVLRHDFYKGGMTGYAKFTRYVGCSNTVDPSEPTANYKSFVFGRNYVGGLFGDYDFAQVADLTTKIENRYNMVNSSNVIGVMYVGGFAGGVGVGCCKQEITTYRNPANNTGSQPSQISQAKDEYNTVMNIKNEGVVLALRRTAIENADKIIKKQDMNIHRQQYGLDANGWQEKYTDEYDTGVGGVIGIARMHMKDIDSIQKEPELALALIGIDKNSVSDVTYEDYLNAFDNTMYGGNGSGGLIGINIVSGINKSGGTSTVSGVIIGDDVTGGILAGDAGNQKPENYVTNVMLDNTLVMGRNMVGGLAGINNFKLSFNNGNSNTKSYKVFGKTGVGGAVGVIATYDGTMSNVNINPADNESVQVRGKTFVGGFAGMNQGGAAASGSIRNINVKADYFAGGTIGAIEGNANTSADRIQIASQNMNVESRYFAGGFAGVIARKKDNPSITGLKNIDKRFLKLANDLEQTGVQAVFVHEGSDNNNCALYCNNTDTPNHYFGNGNLPFNAKVTATEAGAGGIAGYIPSTMKAVIDLSRTDLNCAVTSSGVLNGYSYAGGVTGNIPSGVTVRNASFTGTVNSVSSYLGGIAEVNNGVIRVCTVNSITCNGYNIYGGGLVGLNKGTVNCDNIFAANAVLKGTKNLGGYIGLNQGVLDLAGYNTDGSKTTGQPILGSHASMSIGDRNDTAMGFLIGVNERDIDLRYAGKIESASMSSSKEAGVIAGVNRAHIYNSAFSEVLPDASDRDYRIRYELSNRPDLSLNIIMNVSDVTDAGLLSGRNEGSITDIYINKDPSDTVKGGFINLGDGVDYAGAVTGSNGNGTTEGLLDKCYSFVNTGLGTRSRVAGGITGKIGGRSAIRFCDNYGTVFAKEIAGGIAGAVADDVAREDFIENKDDGTTENHFAFYDCVNSGTVASEINFSAGMAAKVNDTASFELCRNYGLGVIYGITQDDTVSRIHNCLEAGGLNEGADSSANPISPIIKDLMVRDFYISGYYGGAVEDSYTVAIKDTWNNTDDAHWPKKLEIKDNGDGTYDVVFERADYAFKTDIRLSFDPLAETDKYRVFKEMDAMFFNMAVNEGVYRNDDVDNGNGTVTCGFTGNLNAMTPPAVNP